MSIETETLILVRDDGKIPTFEPPPSNTLSKCMEDVRYIFGVLLYVGVISLITCAAQGCLNPSRSGVEAQICEELCPEWRKAATCAAIIIGFIGTLMTYLPRP